jgi:hypothetical protein
MRATIRRTLPRIGARRPVYVGLCLALAAISPSASAATIEVTTPDDPVASSTTCTLRQAIASMNSSAILGTSNCTNTGANFGSSDTVTFAVDVTSVTLADIANNELVVTDPYLTIQGSGNGGVTIGRNASSVNAFRIIHDKSAAFATRLTLSGLTIANGATTATNASGAAVFIDTPYSAALGLTNCIVSANSTSGTGAKGGALAGKGVGVYAIDHGTSISVTESTISGNSTNSANAGGGAIYAAEVTLKDSIVSGNKTTGNSSPGGAVLAPGVHMSYTTVSENSTEADSSPGGAIAAKSTPVAAGGFDGNYNNLTHNTTAGDSSPGGGMYAASVSGVLSLESITNNSTTGTNSNGGGVYIGSYYGASFSSSTISGNEVSGINSSGGGIWSRAGKGAIKIFSNGTLSNNTASVGGGAMSLNVCSSLASRAMNIYNSTVAFNATAAANGGAIIVSNIGCPPAEANKPTSTIVAAASSIFSNTTSNNVASFDIVSGAGFTLTLDTSFSLIENLPSSGIVVSNASGSPALVTADPHLAPLADNGCFLASGAPGDAVCVQTLAIGCGSSAYNGGSNPFSDSFDERGEGFPRIANSLADIGAYEDNAEIFCNGFEVGPAQ